MKTLLKHFGTPTQNDRYEIGKDFPRIAEIRLETDHRSGRVLATVQDGDSGQFAHYIREPGEEWKQITIYDDQIVQAIFGPDNNLFLVSRKNAPKGRVLRLSLVNSSLEKAELIIAEDTDTIVSDFYGDPPMGATPIRLYLIYQLGGPSEIRVFDHNGRRQTGPAVPPVSSVGSIVALDGDDILYRNSSHIAPPAWYRFSPDKGSTRKTALVTKAPVDFSDTEVIREYTTSKDGTRIPINIIHRKNTKLDGSNPVLLTCHSPLSGARIILRYF